VKHNKISLSALHASFGNWRLAIHKVWT